jgi:hypothetical protein
MKTCTKLESFPFIHSKSHVHKTVKISVLKCAKTHLRAFLISKNFPVVIPQTPGKRGGAGMNNEGGREEEGKDNISAYPVQTTLRRHWLADMSNWKVSADSCKVTMYFINVFGVDFVESRASQSRVNLQSCT